MTEYISREYALSCVDDFLSKTDMPIAAQFFYDCFRECEAANVQPVKHGWWDYRGSGSPEFTFRCSCCENISPAEYSYCPNCGARMDGDTNGRHS